MIEDTHLRLSTANKAWRLLSEQERRSAAIVLAIIVVSAAASAAMVGSIMPFLSTLADLSYIERNNALSWLYTTLAFKSRLAFLTALGLASIATIIVTTLIQVIKSYAVVR